MTHPGIIFAEVGSYALFLVCFYHALWFELNLKQVFSRSSRRGGSSSQPSVLGTSVPAALLSALAFTGTVIVYTIQQQMESCSFHHTWVMLGSIPASSGALIASMMYCTMYSAKRLLRETSVFARALFNGLLLLNLSIGVDPVAAQTGMWNCPDADFYGVPIANFLAAFHIGFTFSLLTEKLTEIIRRSTLTPRKRMILNTAVPFFVSFVCLTVLAFGVATWKILSFGLGRDNLPSSVEWLLFGLLIVPSIAWVLVSVRTSELDYSNPIRNESILVLSPPLIVYCIAFLGLVLSGTFAKNFVLFFVSICACLQGSGLQVLPYVQDSMRLYRSLRGLQETDEPIGTETDETLFPISGGAAGEGGGGGNVEETNGTIGTGTGTGTGGQSQSRMSASSLIPGFIRRAAGYGKLKGKKAQVQEWKNDEVAIFTIEDEPTYYFDSDEYEEDADVMFDGGQVVIEAALEEDSDYATYAEEQALNQDDNDYL